MRRPLLLLLTVALPLAPIALLAIPEDAAGGKAKVGPVPVSGAAHPNLAAFDRLMLSFVKDNEVPGAVLAISKDGRLVYARGFGYTDLENKTPVQPNSLMRIASNSKPITALAILLLIQQGKLRMDTHVFGLLKIEPHLPKGAEVDPRLKKVTIGHLLHHTGGWDGEKSGDPMFKSVAIARALGAQPPAQPEHIIRYVFGKPLDFAPGTRKAYSNFGYCVLGRVIEKVTGQSYEDHVRKALLTPLDMKSTRLGKTLLSQRFPREVKYYTKKMPTAPAVVGPKLGEPVPPPYGSFCMEALDSCGGWISSAPDLLRFARSFDADAPKHLLAPAGLRTAFAQPAAPVGVGPGGKAPKQWYACGWSVRSVGPKGQIDTFHTGGLPGTSARIVRRADGVSWAILFNTRNGRGDQSLGALIDPLLRETADKVKAWPKRDLFGK